MQNETDALIRALRAMPAPQPRPGFVDQAFANATGVSLRADGGRSARPGRASWARVLSRWETWFGAVLGGAVAAGLMLTLLRPMPVAPGPAAGITLTLNEARNIDVLIDSDRALEGATIRIAVTGGVALDGLANDHIVDWQTDLDAGANLLSLPVVARSAGEGQLVAVVEHDGKTRTIMIDLTVLAGEASRT